MNVSPRSLILILLLLALVLAGRWLRGHLCEQAGPPAVGWVLPLGGAIVTGVLTAWIWGGFRAVPVVHDESAYLLQAELFSRGLWSLPSPSVPEAFTQAAVLVTPVLAPKMPPGHAFLLAPGVAVGLPGLIPILLISLTGGLIVALARYVASPSVAVLTLAIWLTQAGQMRWRASYMSQATSGALWLAGWWFLLRWRESRRSGWLILLAAAAGVGSVTRPLTMLAWVIPVGIIVLHDVIRSRQWNGLPAAFVVGTACLMILPIQNLAVLRDWRKSPLSLYTRQYIPFDVIGFGLARTSPLLQEPPDLQRAMESFKQLHQQHTVGNLPRILGARLKVLRLQTTGQWRQPWIPAFIVGLFLLSGSGWFALVSGFGLYLAYLLYAHEPSWTAYYTEMTPTVALVCAVGLAWGLARASGKKALPLPLALAAALCILGVGWTDFENSRIIRAGAQRPYRRFLERATAMNIHRALIFVRYDGSADPHLSFVRNVGDRDRAPIITAYELDTARNDSVMAEFSDRTPFVWDQATDQLTPLRPAVSPPRIP